VNNVKRKLPLLRLVLSGVEGSEGLEEPQVSPLKIRGVRGVMNNVMDADKVARIC